MSADNLRLMARFNGWANARLYGAVAELRDEAYHRDRGLFFRSIHGTLNHLLVLDRLWLGRLEGQDHGDLSLHRELYTDFAGLRAAREAEDARMIRVVDALDDEAARQPVSYRVILGEGRESLRCDHLLLGQLNHQTYHRGQVVAALNQDGIEPPPMDVVFYLADHPAA